MVSAFFHFTNLRPACRFLWPQLVLAYSRSLASDTYHMQITQAHADSHVRRRWNVNRSVVAGQHTLYTHCFMGEASGDRFLNSSGLRISSTLLLCNPMSVDSFSERTRPGQITARRETSVGQSLNFIPELESLRGLAALGVLICHLPRGFWFGETGVDLFFVLSGFLITRIIVNQKNERGFLQKFYARRSLRIFPIYYGTLAFVLLANALRSNPEPTSGVWGLFPLPTERKPIFWLGLAECKPISRAHMDSSD
jgi:hypothetical protein